MPWNANSFRKKHNKKLTDAQAKTAAAQATAMVKEGVPEGEAIATANKHAADTSAKAKAHKRYPKS